MFNTRAQIRKRIDELLDSLAASGDSNQRMVAAFDEVKKQLKNKDLARILKGSEEDDGHPEVVSFDKISEAFDFKVIQGLWHLAMGKNIGTVITSLRNDLKRYRQDSKSTIFQLEGQIISIEKTIKTFEQLPRTLGKVQQIISRTHERAAAEFERRSEAPPEAPLGRIAFGEERTDDVPYEKDTAEEKKLYKAFRNHLSYSNKPLDTKETDKIVGLMKKGYYPKFFKEPTKPVIMRGMTVDEKWLRKALKLGKQDLPSRGSQESSFTFTPRRGNASSWARTLQVAKDFSMRSNGKKYQVVLYAYTEENPGKFIDLVGGLYNVDGLDRFPEEKEVIGIGKIKVFKVSWQYWQ